MADRTNRFDGEEHPLTPDPDSIPEQAQRDNDAANAHRKWIIDLPSGEQRILTWADIPTDRRKAPFR